MPNLAVGSDRLLLILNGLQIFALLLPGLSGGIGRVRHWFQIATVIERGERPGDNLGKIAAPDDGQPKAAQRRQGNQKPHMPARIAPVPVDDPHRDHEKQQREQMRPCVVVNGCRARAKQQEL